jgi:hypothetical protein
MDEYLLLVEFLGLELLDQDHMDSTLADLSMRLLSENQGIESDPNTQSWIQADYTITVSRLPRVLTMLPSFNIVLTD